MKQTLLSFFMAVAFAFCVSLNTNAAVYPVSWSEFVGGQLSVCTGVPASAFANGAEVSEGSTLYVNVVPSNGYYLKSLTANGEDITLTRKFTVNAATTLDATFESIPSNSYIVRYVSSMMADIAVYNGSERIASESVVQRGTNLTINVEPSSSVNLSGITVNGSAFTSGGSVTVSSDVVIDYQIASTDVYVNYEYQQTNGMIQVWTAIDGMASSTIQPGVQDDNIVTTMTELHIFAIPNSGYEVESILVNDVPQPIQEVEIYNPLLGTQTYWGAKIFAMCETSLLVQATFKVDDGTGPGGTTGLTVAPQVSKATYDNTTNTLTTDEDVTVFNTSGQAVLKVAAGTQASLDRMSDGVYIVKGATTSLKIVK